jgi:hypothetical protein
MSPREDATRLLQSLPEDVTFGEIMTAICVRIKIEAAIIQLDAGQGIEHDVAKDRLGKWLSS